MAQLFCSGCRTLLMYTQGATSIRCFCCNRVNSTRAASQVAHVTCGQCRTTLMYPHGALTVECAICHYVNNVRMSNARGTTSVHSANGSTLPPSAPTLDARTQTVVVQNPMTVNERGKLVSNVVVGITTGRR